MIGEEEDAEEEEEEAELIELIEEMSYHRDGEDAMKTLRSCCRNHAMTEVAAAAVEEEEEEEEEDGRVFWFVWRRRSD